MRGFYLLLFLALVANVSVLAQNPGDYRSAASGPWDQATTWETFDGATWNPAVAAPSASDGVTTIIAFTTVDITTSVTADEVIIEGDAILNIQPNGGNLTVAAGGLVVTQGDGFFTTDGFMNVLSGGTPGILNNQGTITSSLTNLQIDGTYIHAQNGGIIPNASWNDGSLVSITGITTAGPAGFTGQSFYDLTWDCSQSVAVILSGSLTSVRRHLSVLNTGALAAATLSLTAQAAGSYDPLIIGGDFIIAGNAAVGVAPNTNGVGYQVSVGGNMTITSTKSVGFNVAGAGSQVGVTVGGNFTKNGTTNVSLVNTAGSANNASATLEVNGNFVWASGTLTMAAGTNGSNFCIGTLNIGGDLTINGGTFTETSTSTNGRGEIIFDDAHTHSFTSSVVTPFVNTINFTVPSSNQVNIGATTSFSGIGGLLLSAGATLGIASPQGISLGTSTGNIRVSATGRSYAVNSNIIYNGTGSQNLGDEWGPSGKLNGIAVNLEIANAAGVINNITPSTNLVGNLTLTNGAFDIGSGNSLTVQSNFSSVGGTITGHLDSNLIFAGSGSTGTLNFTSGSAILNNLTINRSGTIILASDLTIYQTGVLAFQGSGNLRINGGTLTVNGDITQTGVGGIASSNTASNLIIGGSGALTALPLCSGCGTNQFNNVTLDRSGTASYTWNSAANINGMLDLVSGSLTHVSGNIIMATGSTLRRSSGTSFLGASPSATTSYNVSYVGNLTTSLELPSSTTALNNLTVAGLVSLDKNIRVNGNLSITSGTLDANTRNVTIAGTQFNVNGGSFTINSTNTVTFVTPGPTGVTLSGSTIGGSTFGNFTINSGARVVAPTANINIKGVWTNNGTFVHSNGTVTFNGASQNINANNQPFWNLITDLGTKTLTGDLDVDGTLTISTGSTLNGSTFNINIGDTWDNNGTFQAASSTVIFDGGAQTIDPVGQSFNNVTFANGNTKTLASALTASGALTINSGTTLDVTTSNYGVTVAGTWSNNGTFTAHQGTVTFSGLGPQSVGGSTNTQFYNITQTNSSTLTMSAPQTLVNALTISAGTFNANGMFTMISNASGDARINPLGGGASITGSMTIQRYLPNSAGLATAVRYLSSPMSNAMMTEWKDDFPITANVPDHSTNAEWSGMGVSPYPFNETGNSIQIYNESKTPTTSRDDRYVGYPTSGTLATTPLLPGVGYNVRPRRGATLNLEVNGTPNFGQVDVTVTAQGVTAEDGWNLIGNPYPAPISWDNVTKPAGVSDMIVLKDNANNMNTGAGKYIYYLSGTGIPASYTGTIAQGQAFWIQKTTAGSTVLSFQEDDKLATSTPPFMRQSDENILRINVAGNNRQDELVIRFRDDAQDTYEGRDAYKLANDFTNFSSMSADQKKLAINTFGTLACSREIPLVLETVTAGPHVFTFSQLESFTAGVDIRLLDAFTGQTFEVNDVNTTYNFDVTSDAASFGKDRFKIYIGYKDLDLSMNVKGQDFCNGSDAQVKVFAPQKGVTYYATLNGNIVSDKVVAIDNEVVLSIPAAKLTSDESTIVIKAQNGSCAEMPLSKSATINKKSLPTISNVTGAANCGEASLTISAAGAPGDGSYRWYLTEDATDAIAGETASSFTTPALAKTKTYFVSAVNALGCESARVAVTATISYPYDIAGVTNGTTCNGGSATLSASGAPESGSYRWYVNETTNTPIEGQSAATFITPALTENTTYFVAAVNAEGCEGARVPVTAEIATVIDATITVENDILVSNADTGNQWYFNGAAIEGATGKTYQPKESGVYKLVVTSGSCSSQVEKEFAVTGDITGDGLKGYVLYPNPTSGSIYVEIATSEDVAVHVMNGVGIEIIRGELKQEGDRKKGQFDISGHAAGVYMVVIKHGQQTVTRKIVKN